MNIPQLDNTYIANTYARFPVTIARGKGSLVWDADGKVYIDDEMKAKMEAYLEEYGARA